MNAQRTTDTYLGMAVLTAEFEDGRSEPVAIASTESEAHELAKGDMAIRRRELQTGGDPGCPASYKLWSQGDTGRYQVVAEIEP